MPAVQDGRVGVSLRALRRRAHMTQREAAARAGVSRWAVSMLERGQLDVLPLRVARAVAESLGARLVVFARWQSGDLDRLLDAAHAALVEQVVVMLRAVGWEVWPEASFSVYGERGAIDVLCWSPAHHVLLVVEVKSRIVDVQELLSGMDRKRRLAVQIAAERGWRSEAVGLWLVVADGRTNRRRLAEHRQTFRSALPGDGREVRRWLRRPAGAGRFVSFLPNAAQASRRRRA